MQTQFTEKQSICMVTKGRQGQRTDSSKTIECLLYICKNYPTHLHTCLEHSHTHTHALSFVNCAYVSIANVNASS